MSRRVHRILNMLKDRSNVQDFENHPPTDPPMLEEPDVALNESFDSNSIPDSQHGLSLSLLDEEYLKRKPNVVVPESDYKSDTSESTSSTSSGSDFSSDDSVKDPDFQIRQDLDISDSDVDENCDQVTYNNSNNWQVPSVGISSVETTSPCVENEIIARRGRKRKANPNLWKKNVSKLLKNSGKAYTSMSKTKRNVEEKKMGAVCLKSSPIYVPDQYITLIKTAKIKGPPHIVKELTHDSFVDLKPLSSGNFTTNEDGEKVKWSNIKVIKIDKYENTKFLYKTSYQDSEFKSVSTLNKGRHQKTKQSENISKPKKLYNQKLNVTQAKKQGTFNLINRNIIPKYYESFFANL